MTDEIAG